MIDSHCHLDFKQYDGRRDEVVSAASLAGVTTIVNIGVDLASSRRSLELAHRYNSIYAAVGVHPHDSRTLDQATLEEIGKLSTKPRVVAIGEIGLDFYRDNSPRDVQRRAFKQQLELAVERQLPVVIHTREAFGETVEILRPFAAALPGGVFHCFQGDGAEAATVTGMGFLVSVGGTITYPNSRAAKMATEVPLEYLMLETDAPFLAPVPFRGKPNSPAYIPYICQKLAELKRLPATEIERATDRNCQRLFRLGDTFGG
jgi:TatD DNase family protein